MRPLAAVFVLSLRAAVSAASDPSYVGAAACQPCHPAAHDAWSGSRHSKMVQPATIHSVKGDFSRAKVTLRGNPYELRVKDGQFFIIESYVTGKPQEHRVDYTLGNRRIQHYLTTLPDGRIIVLPPSWDVLRKEWFHNLEIVDPAEKERVLVQVWNKNCYSCHVSQQVKNFSTEANSYKTEWLDFGTNCERCHGLGSAHVERYKEPSAHLPLGTAVSPAGRGGGVPATGREMSPQRPIQEESKHDDGGDTIVLQTRLDPTRNTMVCAQCHSLRDIMSTGYSAGADYYDYFLPILEYAERNANDPAYWPDGRTRRFSNDAFGLWQSECFLKGGLACTNCHTDMHAPEVEKNERLSASQPATCIRCHEPIGRDIAAHTHHRPESAGSYCVECHMPRTVVSIKTSIRDHSMSIPVPENTIRHGIPNACNVCHKDKKAAWTLAAMKRWYGDGSRQKLIRRADAFVGARASDPKAIDSLISIAESPSEGPLARANAVGYLDKFPKEPRIFPALVRLLEADHALVRAVAALHVSPDVAAREEGTPPLVKALADPARAVRMSAMLSLVNFGVTKLPGDAGLRLERAKQNYLARAAIIADDGEAQLNLGKFHLLNGDPARAETAFRLCLKLVPSLPARYLLALAHLQQNEIVEARTVLKEISSEDPFYTPARGLLGKLPSR